MTFLREKDRKVLRNRRVSQSEANLPATKQLGAAATRVAADAERKPIPCVAAALAIARSVEPWDGGNDTHAGIAATRGFVACEVQEELGRRFKEDGLQLFRGE